MNTFTPLSPALWKIQGGFGTAASSRSNCSRSLIAAGRSVGYLRLSHAGVRDFDLGPGWVKRRVVQFRLVGRIGRENLTGEEVWRLLESVDFVRVEHLLEYANQFEVAKT